MQVGEQIHILLIFRLVSVYLSFSIFDCNSSFRFLFQFALLRPSFFRTQESSRATAETSWLQVSPHPINLTFGVAPFSMENSLQPRLPNRCPAFYFPVPLLVSSRISGDVHPSGNGISFRSHTPAHQNY